MNVLVRYTLVIIMSALLMFVNGCSTPVKGKTFSEESLANIEDAESVVSAVPDFVTEELLNVPESDFLRADIKDSRFDVSVKNIPAKTFFLSLISDVGVNVVTHPKVSGSISLELKDVTVSDVLNVVRDIYGYEYQLKNNIYTIYPAEIRTEVFPVNYIDVKRVGVSDTSVSIGEISSSNGQQSNSSGGNSSGGQSGGGSQTANILGMGGDDSSGGEGISPGSRVQTLNDTDFWTVIKKSVGAIINENNEGRMVAVNPQSGLIIVTAMPEELNLVRSFLDQAELSVQRQVILETQILEVRLSEGFEAGVNWGAIQGQLGYSRNVNRTNDFSGLGGVVKQSTEMFSSIFNMVDVHDLLSLLETQGSVQVLSSPRVSTVNNQKAVIRVGTDEFFVTGLSNNTTSNASSTTSTPEVELASFFSGISLDVTPQISDDGEVILHVHPIVSEVRDQVKELTVGESRISLPLALRDIRESDSIVKVSSGQIIVLGGLMQKTSNKLDSQQPWLGKIPILNALFKQKSNQASKTELVILMRPVVVEDDTWSKQISHFKEFSSSLGEEYRAR